MVCLPFVLWWRKKRPVVFTTLLHNIYIYSRITPANFTQKTADGKRKEKTIAIERKARNLQIKKREEERNIE